MNVSLPGYLCFANFDWSSGSQSFLPPLNTSFKTTNSPDDMHRQRNSHKDGRSPRTRHKGHTVVSDEIAHDQANVEKDADREEQSGVDSGVEY